MSEIELHVAEVYLEGLLERVERGETVTITRDGVPIARVVPAEGRGGRPRAAIVPVAPRRGQVLKLRGGQP